MAKSLAEFFLTNFQAQRHRNARAYGQRRGYRMEWFTYGQVLDMAFNFSDQLEERGIGKGERVMLWGENSSQWVAAFFGCALRGAIVVPMDDGAASDFAERVARQVRAKLWICSRKHAAECSKLSTQADFLCVLDDIKSTSTKDRTRQASSHVETGPQDILQIVFTSGTTAEPKGVVITHGNVLANIAPIEEQIRRYLKYERWVHPVRFLNLLPLSHVFGQFLGMFLPPLLGSLVIFQSKFKPSEIVSTIRRERISVLVTVPRVLQSLKQKIERRCGRRCRWQKKDRTISTAISPGGRKTFSAAVVDFSRHPERVWLEVLGVHLRRRGSRCRDRRILGSAGICGDSGIRLDGNHIADQRESSVQAG